MEISFDFIQILEVITTKFCTWHDRHVQKFVAIWYSGTELQQNEISMRYDENLLVKWALSLNVWVTELQSTNDKISVDLISEREITTTTKAAQTETSPSASSCA